LVAAGYQVIAPSRFGYLRSSSPNDASPQNQADAFAVLLDGLHIQNVAVVGISAGALSALQFAERYPDRCRSLTLIVPAASTTGGASLPGPAQGALSKSMFVYNLKSDFIFWLGIIAARDQMIRTVLATNLALVAAATPEERRRVHEILWNILPISERTQGILNDTRFTSTLQYIAFEQIKVPTLVVSLEDDLYGTITPARYLAAKIPGARLVTYASGGHIWVGRDAELFTEVDGFLKERSAD
jgi:pimeloyl-ACP methyl ester carboxylesterase